MRFWASCALLVIGCYRSHDLRDGGRERDAPIPSSCLVPRGGNCCCEGDVLSRPICAGDHWECEPRFDYFEGPICTMACGPCSLPCFDAGGPPDLVECTGVPPLFPDFARVCNLDSDCVVARHQTDCCGSIHFMGISSYEQARFDAAERTCESQYPACMCVGREFADDMTTPASGPMPYVRCNAGTCVSSFFLGG